MNWKVRTASFLLCLGILLVTIQDGTAEKKIVCYYTNWSVYRPGTAKFSPQNINPYLCTHLIYAFGGFTKDNAMKPFDKYQDIEKGGYAKFTGLKTYNKNLKTMLAIGGWNEGSSRFSPMVADVARRKEFVKNAIKFLRQNHFDGLDLDWEYPAYRDGGKPRDKNNYADLVQELRAEFDRESSKTGRPRLLLTMAIPAGLEYIEKGYDLSRLNEYLDFFNLLSYDYHSAYEPAVNHHSPLYPLEEDNEYNYDNELTVDYTINELLKKGASAEKIVLGIPTYGRSYTLFNEDATDIGSPADGPGVEGDATREKGYLAYYEICESLADSDEWEVVQPNPTAMGPYAFKGNQWVGYDDEDIVRLKAKYVNERNLGGIMFWSIDNDDFRGKCHGRPYPLIEAAKEALLVTETKNSPGQKTSSTFNRKKNNRGNTGIQSNVIGRKFGRSSTTSTTEEPTQRKRVSSARKKLRSRQRGNEDDEEKEVESRSFASRDDDSEALSGNAVRSVEKGQAKPRSRGKSRNRSTSGRRKPSKRREEDRQDSAEEEESLSFKLTTPEPPTTPDPGSDFKCEDEGFFPHPRDCKKYFWCLDSGPGGLGVVAHQFTCPSGLVFNKAADSCDYPRNVICPKVKSSQSTVSTTRAPITAATSRTTYLHSTTRRTTTSKPESEEEYEYYEDEEETEEEDEEEEEEPKPEPKITTTSKPLQYKTINRSRPTSTTTTTSTTPAPKTQTTDGERSLDIDEEDPKVIKELINLIKKAGGIEQLEKQLLFQDKSSAGETSGSEKVTPATISRSLYERVLSRQAGKAIAGNRQAVSSTSRTINYANGPGGAQFEGLDEVPEVKSLRRTNRPQYVTIERPKPSTTESTLEDEEELADEEAEEDNEDVASSEEENISDPVEKSTQSYRITPSYVNIRRSRPTTTTSRSENDVIEKDEVVDDEPTVRRRRPLNPRTVENEEDSPRAEASEGESVQKSRTAEETRTTKSRYVGIQRFRSTTPRSVDNDFVSGRRSTSTRKIDEASEDESTTLTLTSSTSSSSPKVSSTSTSLSALNIGEASDAIGTLSSGTSGIYSDGTMNYDVTTSLSGISSTTVSGDYASIASTSTDSTVKLVEDSATEILLTTVQGLTGSAGSSSTTLRSSTVSQPRPFGFTRRRLVGSAVPPAVTSSTESTRSKVASSEKVKNLPTLKELVGRQSFNDRTTTPYSMLLNLLHLDYDDTLDREILDENATAPKFIDQSAYKERKVSENSGIVLTALLANHADESNDIFDEDSSNDERRARIERNDAVITTVKPTTMRRTPFTSSTVKSSTRGFYVTKAMPETTLTPFENVQTEIATTESVESVTTMLENENFVTRMEFNSTNVPLENENFVTRIELNSTNVPLETENFVTRIELNSTIVPLETTTETVVTETTFPTEKLESDYTATTMSMTIFDEEVTTANDVGITEKMNIMEESSLKKKEKSVVYEEEILPNTMKYKDLNFDWTTLKPSETKTEEEIIEITTYNPTTVSSTLLPASTEISRRNIRTRGRQKYTPSTNFVQENFGRRSRIRNTNRTRNRVNLEDVEPKEIATTLRSTRRRTIGRNRHRFGSINSEDSTKTGLNPGFLGNSGESSKTKFVPSESIAAESSEGIVGDFRVSRPLTTKKLKTTTEPLTTIVVDDIATTFNPKNGRFDKLFSARQKQEQREFQSTTVPLTTVLVDDVVTTFNPKSNTFDKLFSARQKQERKEFQTTTVPLTTVLVDDVATTFNPKTNRFDKLFSARQKQDQREFQTTTVPLTTVLVDDVVTTFNPKSNTFDKLFSARQKQERKEFQSTMELIDDTLGPTLDSKSLDGSYEPANEVTTIARLSRPSTRRPGIYPRNDLLGRSKERTTTLPTTTSFPFFNDLHSTAALLTNIRKIRPTESSVPTTAGRTENLLILVDSTETPTKPENVESNRLAEGNDQAFKAQELAVSLADPPATSSQSSSSSSSSGPTGRGTLKDTSGRRISTTISPLSGRSTVPTRSTTNSRLSSVSRNRQKTKAAQKVPDYVTTRPRRPPIIDYDYYGDEEESIVGKPTLNGKLFLTNTGTIRCLDQGNFPHPSSCKKFITCARMVNGLVIGAEYTCPDKLSFDPVGGICNWSAGIGCKE